MAQCLGKGEADSSILSGSTRNPHLFLDTDLTCYAPHYAIARRVVARTRQGLFYGRSGWEMDMDAVPKVKRDFVMMVELRGDPTPQQIVDAVALLRREAEAEFGLGFTERADVIGRPHMAGSPYPPKEVPVLILRAFPPREEAA